MNNWNYWKQWLKAAGVRAVKTFFQTFASLLTVGAVIVEIDWVYILSVSAVAMVASMATSLAGLPEIKIEEPVEDDAEGDEE